MKFLFNWDWFFILGNLFNEEEVLNWLFEFQDLGEEGEAIEDVSPNALSQMIEDSQFLAVLFCKLFYLHYISIKTLYCITLNN